MTDSGAAQRHLSLAIELCRLLSQAVDVSASDYRAVAYHCRQTLRVAGLTEIIVNGPPGVTPPHELRLRLESELARARHCLGLAATCAIETAQEAAEGAWRRAQTEVRA